MSSPTQGQPAFACVDAFVDELARAGLRHVCVAPGSRSTPLALTIAARDEIRLWTHIDERSAGFFALGMARALGAPVALLCTSGTAAANLLPAVVEAMSAGVPLLVLTADRPPELREVGAPQTIDQHRLYGTHAKWFADVHLPDVSVAMLRYARTLAGRAMAAASRAPRGPVHLNFPFREPLIPTRVVPPAGLSPADALAWNGRPDNEPWVRVTDAPAVADDSTLTRLAERLRASRRPLIICGPQPDAALADPLSKLAAALGAPLLADALSQLRWGAHERMSLIDRYDAVLKHDETSRRLAPDLMVRFGTLPTSRSLLDFVQRHAAVESIVVDAALWPDPIMTAAEMVHAEPSRLASSLVARLSASRSADPAWLAAWREVDDAAGRALVEHCDSVEELYEGRVLAEVASMLPSGGTLFVSSSMPVRDLDSFAPGDERAVRVMANRGANGIDGVVSTALGVAAASDRATEGPLVLVIGDLAFHHDMNGLVAARLHELDATILVINNDGGGIFSFLPQASNPEHFERLFGTPHGLVFEQLAAMYGACYSRADTFEELRYGMKAGIEGRGLHIVEIRTDRARNVMLHDQSRDAVLDALGLLSASQGA